jgi:uncharacterized protein YcfL
MKNILILIAVVVAVVSVGCRKNNQVSVNEDHRLIIGQDSYSYVGTQTGVVKTTHMLVGTPSAQTFPVLEVVITNDSGRAFNTSALYLEQSVYKDGETVEIVTVQIIGVSGGKYHRFVKKLPQK